jgi:predicted nucleic acid-binding protein
MIFVDTGFFYALASAKDPDHDRVVEVFETFRNQRLSDVLLTTNHVVFETIQLARSRRGRAMAVSVGKELYSQKLARIHWVTPEEEKAAFDYMIKYKDQNYSLVDCLSFFIMDQLGIDEALAVDSHFTHRFIARPGPSRKDL